MGRNDPFGDIEPETQIAAWRNGLVALDTVQTNGELSKNFGVYRTVCRDAEIVIGRAFRFRIVPTTRICQHSGSSCRTKTLQTGKLRLPSENRPVYTNQARFDS
jgi:hypothetical protein